MTMTSPSIQAEANAWLVRMRDESVDATDRVAFEAWLAADPQHHEAYTRASGAVDRVALMGTDLRALLDEAPTRAPQRSIATIAMAMAAAFLIAVLVGVQLTSPPAYATAIGEQRIVTLDDGSQIELNTNSRVVVRYSADSREIELERGEALFSVTHDPSRPFVVVAGDADVRAIGTRFSVHRQAEGLDVVVVEGVVALRGGVLQETPRLTAGQSMRISAAGANLIELAPAEVERSLAWRTGWITFAGEPLEDAAREMARYSNAVFEIEDRDLRALPVLAHVRADDLDGFVESLAQSDPSLVIQRSGERVRIGRRASTN
ncbi:MAG TPA: FecR domain-containing protein [Verrucomicrobiae bacterium]|nr:FecR domain-containing protein [Verrucomicrobiae bacterium]